MFAIFGCLKTSELQLTRISFKWDSVVVHLDPLEVVMSAPLIHICGVDRLHTLAELCEKSALKLE